MPVLLILDPIIMRHFPSEVFQAVVGSRKSLAPIPGGGTKTGLPEYLTHLRRRGSSWSAGYARFCTWTDSLVDPVYSMTILPSGRIVAEPVQTPFLSYHLSATIANGRWSQWIKSFDTAWPQTMSPHTAACGLYW